MSCWECVRHRQRLCHCSFIYTAVRLSWLTPLTGAHSQDTQSTQGGWGSTQRAYNSNALWLLLLALTVKGCGPKRDARGRCSVWAVLRSDCRYESLIGDKMNTAYHCGITSRGYFSYPWHNIAELTIIWTTHRTEKLSPMLCEFIFSSHLSQLIMLSVNIYILIPACVSQSDRSIYCTI